MSTAILVAALTAAVVTDARRVTGSPEQTGRAYLDAWAGANQTQMRDLVASPPADFLEVHRRLSSDLQILSIKLTAGAVVRRGEDAADMSFDGVRQVGELGQWRFSSVLHLAVRDGAWKVVWTPQTLMPGIGSDERLRLSKITVPGTELLTREGKPLPHDSGADAYFKELAGRIDDLEKRPATGWAIEAVSAKTGGARRLIVFRHAMDRSFRTTLDWWTQAAAARALDGAGAPAALVAVRPSTGEVLAVADRLPGQGAFYTPAPPGPAFEIVTAAALLRDRLAPGARVGCPASYTVPKGPTFGNAGDQDHGTVTVRRAFALSCDTSFTRLAAERLKDGGLRREAAGFGFGGKLKSGLGGVCGSIRAAGDPGELAADAIGGNSVRATPLCMASVAAAVQNGAWRPPRLMSERAVARLESGGLPKPKKLPAPVAVSLRTMMSAVVTGGTAASAGLPAGTAGKTGTARSASGGEHAWFVGYQGDLAFAVFVEGGGSGADAAAPIAARFLGAL
ncbi:penicillin-binding transpeptidase domain-containing protein [Sphaerisporangium sp. NPDC051017]|uniref:penicillin-binding transpeptidase domain-containing protein n=1 Tax=Sphaerisporangium sp. NPDC051017 TaxID=3154636 RepID=UPI00342ACFCB